MHGSMNIMSGILSCLFLVVQKDKQRLVKPLKSLYTSKNMYTGPQVHKFFQKSRNHPEIFKLHHKKFSHIDDLAPGICAPL
jgi:hypothetical protein